MERINSILRELAIGKNYKGHREIAYAIQLLLEDEDRLCAVVKEIYIPVRVFSRRVERGREKFAHRHFPCVEDAPAAVI